MHSMEEGDPFFSEVSAEPVDAYISPSGSYSLQFHGGWKRTLDEQENLQSFF